MSEGGTLTLKSVSQDRIVGSFDFTGRYIEGDKPGLGKCVLSRVRGTFTAYAPGAQH